MCPKLQSFFKAVSLINTGLLTFSGRCVTMLLPARVQRPLLHAGNPGGPEPSRGGGEEGAQVQLQEAEGEAGEALQHEGGAARQVHPGDRGQARDAEPGVGRALCLVSPALRGHVCEGHDCRIRSAGSTRATEESVYCRFAFTMKLTFFCLSDSEVDDVYNDLLHLDIW